MSAPTTSVVIPAFRAEATLPRVLDALEPQIVGASREVLVADSTGHEAARAIARTWPWVRTISFGQRVLPGRARNAAAMAARGELLAFIDADAVPAPDWLDELERAMTADCDMVAGAVLNGTPRAAWGTVAYLLEFLEWRPGRRDPLAHGATCNLLVRRSAFERCGGFVEDLWPGEDTVLSAPFARTGRLTFAPKARVAHLNRTGAKQVLAHQRRLGASWVGVCRRVHLRGAWLAAPALAPIAVIGRLYSLPRQLRGDGMATFAAASCFPLLVAGLMAWGLGVWEAGRTASGETPS